MLREPVAHQIDDEAVALVEDEVVGAGDEMEIARLPGVQEQIY